MLILIYERLFKKDFKLMEKRRKNTDKLIAVIKLLSNDDPLPLPNRNHKLRGNYKGTWECHIEPDWLLIYKKTKTELILSRTGTHSDLF